MIIALDPYVSWVRDFLLSPKTQRYVVKAFFALLVVGSLIFFATLAYAAFYWVYVPKIAHKASVYLQYQDDLSAAKGTARREPPTGVVDVTGTNEPFLAAGQEYDVSVELVMPTSERNVQHGNFMVGVRLLNEKGNAVTNSSRPVSLFLPASYSTLPNLRLADASSDRKAGDPAVRFVTCADNEDDVACDTAYSWVLQGSPGTVRVFAGRICGVGGTGKLIEQFDDCPQRRFLSGFS
ncbi:MAG: putative adipose-regulatory protein-domain-containing protein [Olpidium bornovanus]|uniref:Adipose-regulatory protein-domain-containing protein n=1 Tax=Olpidium bornovanus TaxID=278681 RepID=A0A8H8DID2_9FUNG|nr:MAG: putative adipose-regulatory protein-domain-containing protein [Olpidium bornovanus]